MDDCGRSPIRSGLIVMADCRTHSHIRGAVLDLEELLETGFVCIRCISSEAFRLPSAKMNLELSVRKNLERRLNRPLIFGDIIEYNIEEHLDKRGFIRSFERLAPYIKSRMKDGEGQILLEGIVNPIDPAQFYTSYFRNITIPTKHQKEASPNVYIEAWITIYYRDCVQSEVGSIDYEFDSFNRVCSLEKQFDVGTAPWNKANLHFCVFAIDDDDEEDSEYGAFAVHIANPKKISNRPDLELYKREAYMTGDRSFLLLEFPQYKCLAPLKKVEDNLQTGNLYLVDCFWNPFEKMYMVSNTGPSKKPDTLCIDPETKLLRHHVVEHPKYRGIFYSELFGYMDDPNGILAFLHFSKNRNNSVPVAILDDGPSRSGQLRFRIARVLGDKAEKLQKILEEEVIVSDAFGVVINDNYVFCALHSPLTFVFDSNDKPPDVGAQIIFEAKYDNDKKKFYITSWKINSTLDLLAVKKKRMLKNDGEKEQTIFQVKIRRCPETKLDKMFYCDEFGIIDDNLGIIADDGHNGQREYDVWLSPSLVEIHEITPRTPFHIVAAGKDVPADRYKKPDVSAKNQKINSQLYHQLLRAQLSYDNTFMRRPNASVTVQSKANDSESVSSVATDSSVYSHTVNTYNEENFKDHSSSLNSQQLGTQSKYESSRRLSVDSVSARGSVVDDISNIDQRMSNFNLYDDRSSQHSHYSSMSSNSKRRINDDSCSLRTDDGASEPTRQKRKKELVPKYSGPILASDNSKHQFDVVETLFRLKEHVPHSNCGSKCASDCPYINAIAQLIVEEPEFWEETTMHYPAIAMELVRVCKDPRGR